MVWKSHWRRPSSPSLSHYRPLLVRGQGHRSRVTFLTWGQLPWQAEHKPASRHLQEAVWPNDIQAFSGVLCLEEVGLCAVRKCLTDCDPLFGCQHCLTSSGPTVWPDGPAGRGWGGERSLGLEPSCRAGMQSLTGLSSQGPETAAYMACSLACGENLSQGMAHIGLNPSAGIY